MIINKILQLINHNHVFLFVNIFLGMDDYNILFILFVLKGQQQKCFLKNHKYPFKPNSLFIDHLKISLI